MYIVFNSPDHWPDVDRIADTSKIRMSCARVAPDNLAKKNINLNPDIVFLKGYPVDGELFIQLEALSTALPNTAIIPIVEAPTSDQLMRLMQAGVREVLPSDDPRVIQSAIRRVESRRVRFDSQIIDMPVRCFGFMSAKGGDGATAAATNLAVAMAAKADSPVLLIDLSLPFGDADLFLTAEALAHDLADFCEESSRLDAALLDQMVSRVSDKLHLIASPPTAAKLVRVGPNEVMRLFDLARQHYRWVLVDLGDSIDPARLAVIEKLDQVVLVSSLTMASLRRGGQILRLLESLELARNTISVVVSRVNGNSEISAVEFERALGQSIDRQLPLDAKGMSESLLRGLPMMSLRPKSDFSRAIGEWANQLLGRTSEKSKWRLFGSK